VIAFALSCILRPTILKNKFNPKSFQTSVGD